MEMLAEVLPLIIYFLLIILLIIAIVIGIKLIGTMNKVEEVVNQINDKVQSLNGLFSIIDFTTDKIAALSDGIVNFISDKLRFLFRRKRKKESDEDE